VIFGAIFDNDKLQGLANLWGREANAGRVTHGVPHVSNEFLNMRAQYFVASESAGLLAQDFFSGLYDLESHDGNLV